MLQTSSRVDPGQASQARSRPDKPQAGQIAPRPARRPGRPGGRPASGRSAKRWGRTAGLSLRVRGSCCPCGRGGRGGRAASALCPPPPPSPPRQRPTWPAPCPAADFEHSVISKCISVKLPRGWADFASFCLSGGFKGSLAWLVGPYSGDAVDLRHDAYSTCAALLSQGRGVRKRANQRHKMGAHAQFLGKHAASKVHKSAGNALTFTLVLAQVRRGSRLLAVLKECRPTICPWPST